MKLKLITTITGILLFIGCSAAELKGGLKSEINKKTSGMVPSVDKAVVMEGVNSPVTLDFDTEDESYTEASYVAVSFKSSDGTKVMLGGIDMSTGTRFILKGRDALQYIKDNSIFRIKTECTLTLDAPFKKGSVLKGKVNNCELEFNKSINFAFSRTVK